MLSNLSAECADVKNFSIYESSMKFLTSSSFMTLWDLNISYWSFLDLNRIFSRQWKLFWVEKTRQKTLMTSLMEIFMETNWFLPKAQFISDAAVLEKVILSSDDVIDDCLAYRCLLSELLASGLFFENAQLISSHRSLVETGGAPWERNSNEWTLSLGQYNFVTLRLKWPLPLEYELSSTKLVFFVGACHSHSSFVISKSLEKLFENLVFVSSHRTFCERFEMMNLTMNTSRKLGVYELSQF